MPKPIGDSTRYNPAIDGMRTLAVLGVIFYHMNISFVPGGLLGVGVFFTISGYLITGNLMRSWDTKGNLSLSTFWLRRFRRLMPAVIVTVLAVWILTAVLQPDKWGQYFFGGWTTLLYINNWATIFYGDSYFDRFSASPLEHMWSLSVEEQFYLFWPLILLLFLVATRGRRWLVGLLTLLLASASFVEIWLLYNPLVDSTRIYEGTDTRASGLLLGAVLAIWFSNRRSIPHRALSEVSGSIGLATILVFFVVLPDNTQLLYPWGLMALSVASVLLIFGVLNPKTLTHQLLGWRPFAWVGERSYAVYLWHMPIIAFLYRPLHQLPLWASTLIVLALSILIASLSWICIEDPIRRNGLIKPLWDALRRRGRFPRPAWATVLALLVAVVLIGAPAYTLNRIHDNEVARAQQQADAVKTSTKPTSNVKPTQTSCREVVHVGDSTSLAMFTQEGVNSPADTGEAAYRAAGAQIVINSSFGARATNMAINEDPSGDESITEILAGGVDPNTCWVIALGVNNAANMAVVSGDTASAEIANTMSLIGSQYPVLWISPTTSTQLAPRWYETPNMVHWNETLLADVRKYPNLWVYRWDQDVQQEWFLEGDGVHYNVEGNTQRSRHFASALIEAFPKVGEESTPLRKVPAAKRVFRLDG
ncbi:MAG: acyltransferase family protein [Varibaculum sp.]|nr:acyltransferase family protein [Varibaculum sp.]